MVRWAAWRHRVSGTRRVWSASASRRCSAAVTAPRATPASPTNCTGSEKPCSATTSERRVSTLVEHCYIHCAKIAMLFLVVESTISLSVTSDLIYWTQLVPTSHCVCIRGTFLQSLLLFEVKPAKFLNWWVTCCFYASFSMSFFAFRALLCYFFCS